MIVSIVGAGAMGSAIARFLLADELVSKLRIMDMRKSSLHALEPIKDPKLSSFKINARDLVKVREVVEGSHCMISCVEPSDNVGLASLALDIGAHYVDQGGSEVATGSILSLSDRASEAGVWLVPNCGLTPGLVDIASMWAVEQFDKVERVSARFGSIPLTANPPFNCQLSSSASKMLDDYTRPTHVIENGQINRVPSLSREEHIFFDEPFGLLEAFCSASGTTLLARELEGKVNFFDLKTLSRPGHADQMSFLLGLGFGDEKIIDVRTHLTYRDLLMRKLRQHLSASQPDAVLVRIMVTGWSDGQERTFALQTVHEFDETLGISALRFVAGAATAEVTHDLISGNVKGGGAAPPERIVDKRHFLDRMESNGIRIESQWFDGHLHVTDRLRID